MLKIQFKDQRSEAIWVVERIYSLGSGANNDLVINDPSVSSEHAQLITLDDKLYLKDNSNGAGCFVNNEKVDKKQVVPGDTVRLGNVEILVMDPRDSVFQEPLTDEQLEAHWSLVAKDGWLAGQEYFITKSPTTIGRSQMCDIIISGTHLSRQHAEIKVQGNLLHVRDLASANGTYINNERVSQGIARPGDEIRLDSYTFRVISPNTDHNLTQVRPPPQRKPIKPVRPSELPTKQWKTRPTSPGNRILEIEGNKRSRFPRVLTGLLVLVSVAALVYYYVKIFIS